jgi:hydroxymethylglutaryl-CoA lyase
MPDGKNIKLVECPRDAMQGWKEIIPTATKIAYLNTLLRVGFDTIDFGSFVSAAAIPQMADTKQVLEGLDLSATRSKLLAIVANSRGAAEAAAFDEISYLGYPFSVSETFQRRNTNADIATSLHRVQEIQEICLQRKKELVVYISMGFGNPYGDPYSADIVFEWVTRLVGMDIGIISLADTVGVAEPEQVYEMTSFLIASLPQTEIGVHLHSHPGNWKEKLAAAWNAGCTRFDGALRGVGGCPMADDALVGNMNTEWMIDFFSNRHCPMPSIERDALAESSKLAAEIFQ